ncbi:MAG: aldehyde dehydrogenase family protein [Acidobacteriota bacterium]|nr:aldehyde dehydrogenase family protein [Acidobacteriota bacterium]
MSERPVLIAGRWRPARATAKSFQAIDPVTGLTLPPLFPISSWNDVEEALASGSEAAASLASFPPGRIADGLDFAARGLLERADELVRTAARETALPAESRLRASELPRTVGQLHQAAAAARDGSWRRPTIDSRLNIRSRLEPLGGPVFVLGPNNFPLAFNSASGGDFAAALAAGNPVLAKAHPSHPETTRLLSETVFEALRQAGLPDGSFQMLYHIRPEDGLRLVADPRLGATAFTGSRAAGLRLKAAADAAGKPIFLEMSGLNPVFLLPSVLRQRAEELAGELFASCSLGSGQFCTKPGLVAFIGDDGSARFQAAAAAAFRSEEPGFLLGPAVLEGLRKAVERMIAAGAEILAGGRALPSPGFRFENTLLRITARAFLNHPAEFQSEAFGTASILVAAADADELEAAAEAIEGTLAASIYSESGPEDEPLYARIAPRLRVRSGRLLDDKMPTGLAVVPSMVHGGPFPASGHPGFTAVGLPAAMTRFAALRAYDNVRPSHLPPDLQDGNPDGRMRFIDGEWTRAAIESH